MSSNRTTTTLARHMLAHHSTEAARVLEAHDPAVVASLLDECENEPAAAVLSNMARGEAAACLLLLSSRLRRVVLEELGPDTAASIIRTLPEDGRTTVLENCPKNLVRSIERRLGYTEDMAGAMMNSSPIVVDENTTVAQTRGLLERTKHGQVDIVCVIDTEERLAGVLPLHELFRAPADAPLGRVMHADVPHLKTRARLTEITSSPGWQQYHTLPVVDRKGILVGVISSQMLRSLQEKRAIRGPEAALGLAIGEMYWTVMTSFVRGLTRALQPVDMSKNRGRS